MKPTEDQKKNFPKEIIILSPDGKEVLTVLEGMVVWKYMVKNGFKKFTKSYIKKAVNSILDEALAPAIEKPKRKKQKTKKTS